MPIKTKIAVIGLVFVVLAAAIVFVSVQSGRSTRSDSQVSEIQTLSVVASFYPVYFFAQQIGGDHAEVTNITPAGAEPHDYEPSPQDIAHIQNSRLLILNGGEVDVWGDRIRQDLDPSKTIVVIAGEGLMTRQIEDESNAIIADPHVWLSPQRAERMIDTITSGYIQADPENGPYYRSNATTLKTRLADLDEEFRRGLVACKSKDIITSHAAFGYLAAAYGLNQVPISGISPDEEPSAQALVKVATFAKDNNVKYIFFEHLVSPKLSQTIATEVGAQTLVLNPLEGLTEEEIAAGKDYFTEMHDNLVNLQTALVCTP